ncbi:MAG: helix-turn-helix transcriptional regulator [Rhodocyclaceae bacterium]|nr:helix-turn-helix transcriptional regulator [Rhodocyclaceae bacterium]
MRPDHGTACARRLSSCDIAALASRCGYAYAGHYGGEASASNDAVVHGVLEHCDLGNGLLIVAADAQADCTVRAEAVFPAGLTLGVCLRGAVEGIFSARTRISLETGRCIAMHMRDPVSMSGLVQSGKGGRMLSIRGTPEWLEAAQVPVPQAGSASLRVQPFELPPGLPQIAEGLFSPALTGPLRKLMAEGCALTLISHAGQACGMRTGLSVRDRIRMTRVREIIEADPFADYSLASLAGEAGVGLSTLKHHFPRAYGKTVFEFLRDRRLESAYQALNSGRWTVSEAAYAVGFSHPSSFSTAFKRKFGFPPRQYTPRKTDPHVFGRE